MHDPLDYTPREVAAILRDPSLDPELAADVDRLLPTLRRAYRLLLTDIAMGYTATASKRRWQLPGHSEDLYREAIFELTARVNGVTAPQEGTSDGLEF